MEQSVDVWLHQVEWEGAHFRMRSCEIQRHMLADPKRNNPLFVLSLPLPCLVLAKQSLSLFCAGSHPLLDVAHLDGELIKQVIQKEPSLMLSGLLKQQENPSAEGV